MEDYFNKYIKYKKKYLSLKGGVNKLKYKENKTTEQVYPFLQKNGSNYFNLGPNKKFRVKSKCLKCGTNFHAKSNFCSFCKKRKLFIDKNDTDNERLKKELLEYINLKDITLDFKSDSTKRFIISSYIIGRGAQKNVFLGFDTKVDYPINRERLFNSNIKKVNITNTLDKFKLVAIAKLDFDWDNERFYNSINLLQNIKHPNIIDIIYFSEVDKILVTDYYPYLSLEKHIPDLNIIEKMLIIKQILQAVNYLHSIGVIHRDLKPHNILLDSYDSIVVIDFDMASKFSKHNLKPSAELRTSSVLKEGEKKSLLGTPLYMAPEIADLNVYGGNYDNKVDIYSIGIIFATMIFNKKPFNANFAMSINHVLFYQGNTNKCYNNNRDIFKREWFKIFSKISIRDTLSENLCDISDNDFLEEIIPSDERKERYVEYLFLDFFKSCVLRPEKRLSASELLNHEIFNLSKEQLLNFEKSTLNN